MAGTMKPLLKRIIAITGLVFMVTGTVFLIMYSFNQELLNGAPSTLAIVFLGLGILCYFAILAFKGFPMQQAKEEERKRIEEEYYKKLEEEENNKKGTDESVSDAIPVSEEDTKES